MTKNAIAWIREDFRIEHNPALSYATQNHENVIALFIYNKADFDHKREAQKWWLFKSLEIFKSELSKYKINLQVLAGDELDIFSKIKKKDDVSIYWNKIYEPDVIAKGKKIRDVFLKNEVDFKYFKGFLRHGEGSIELGKKPECKNLDLINQGKMIKEILRKEVLISEKINEYKARTAELSRKMLATVSELSMF